MKLRIHGNSLRLRLNQSEVAQFSKTGFIEDSIQFAPGASFAYALESLSSLSAPQALYANGWLRVQVPGAAGTEWACSDRVSISGDQPLESGKRLSILVEKDFQCVHGERDPHAYPNPLEEPVR
jgi:Family of unknown function (DUF7009)